MLEVVERLGQGIIKGAGRRMELDSMSELVMPCLIVIPEKVIWRHEVHAP
jgi:hypothetical protein